MNRDSNKIYGAINPLLGLLAAFNLALTLYSCTQFYAYLPTSDTWIYVDFLSRAALGHLDLTTLFEKHNGAHVIALPKLVYFLDVWLTQGSGVLTVFISLLAQLASLGLFFLVIQKIEGLNKNEKNFLSLTSVIFLLSGCQVESLLNPANLQWSLLVFSAVFTAWSLLCYSKTKSVKWLLGLALGVLLVALTSASPFLILIPIAAIFYQKIPLKKFSFTILAVVVILIAGIGIYSLQLNVTLALILALIKNILKFIVDFMAPPVERLNFLPATLLTGILLLVALTKVFSEKSVEKSRENIFLKLLLLFSLFLIIATGVVRFYSPAAFTFRFVNIGLLFSLTLISYLYLQLKGQRFFSVFIVGTFIYLLLLSYINYTEVSAFGYGRNHVRLNQVAYSLDMREPAVVSALPGTIWEQQDYDFVQANKQKLKERGIGIYSDAAYQHMGADISTLTENNVLDDCAVKLLKIRRLLPDQAAYKLTGTVRSSDGRTLSRMYFTDESGILRGFGIPVLSSRDLWESFRQGKQWSGFVNLDQASEKESLQAYAYDNTTICKPQTIELPAFRPFIKKEKNRN